MGSERKPYLPRAAAPDSRGNRLSPRPSFFRKARQDSPRTVDVGGINAAIEGEGEKQAFVACQIIEHAVKEIRRLCRGAEIFPAEAGFRCEAPRPLCIDGKKDESFYRDILRRFFGHFLGYCSSRRRRQVRQFTLPFCGQVVAGCRFLQLNFPFVNFSLLLLVAVVGMAGCGWSAAFWAELVHIMQKSVLIVEDNELNMKLFNDLLEAHGYQTVQTRSGVEAVELARRHRPDLILMDIQLPEVSGLQVTQWIKDDEDLRHIPVIAITAFAMKGDEEKIRQGGCEAYLSKPISVVKFLETVRNYISDP